MLTTWRRHWPEYGIEAALLGCFMVSAAAFGTLLGYPGSPVVAAVPDPMARRLVMGLVMGATAIALIYSPWGQRSGAHLNPSVTLAYFRLGKVARPDALSYVAAQFAGGVAGVALVAWLVGPPVGAPPVRYAATVPGPAGAGAAFVAEAAISFVLMLAVLVVSNAPRVHRLTGLVAGGLVATYIALEAPISGMSMNPARTFGSALPAWLWSSIWVYFTAPPLGMLLAAEAYVRVRGSRAVLCAKLNHHGPARCIFRCGFPGAATRTP